ncbi:hypothetical protein ASC97_29865 [Rhizobium sp. Root1203]|uniref:B12-binding domain-containing radical SAM protein n=1 Tax=Rhizobium sp. Root1203 TaxID=1736427 RepID=UPI00071065B4|nr:radical SAM protein [Rhizobium sp. Root1203]KQV18266.1 hypothetical protein ASC97_29865 [Rhizobium sp. Root1203]
MIAVIVNPPFVDPTCPPHFAAYLIGCARNNGISDVVFADLNVEVYNHFFEQEFYAGVKSECADVLDRVGQMRAPHKLDQARYRAALSAEGISWEALHLAELIMKSPSEFYDIQRYKAAASLILRYMRCIGAGNLPSLIGFGTLHAAPYTTYNFFEDLQSDVLLHAVMSSIGGVVEKFIQSHLDNPPKVFGISCNYQSQLLATIGIAKQLEIRFPGARIILGGTEITELYKSADSLNLLWRLFPRGVILVVGEGETAFVKILSAVRDGRSDFKSLHPNIASESDGNRVTDASIEDINAIGDPAYDIYSLDRYWSPEPVLLYSPTRGCYWNKCTFCDYGLNFNSPTSPSRQRRQELIASDLDYLSGLTRHVYLAVDAIAPSILRKIAQQIADANIELNWSAEVRLERRTTSIVDALLLKSGGCVALSFGLESAVQRVLDLIDKGVRIDAVRPLLESLTAVGIHCQLMGFVGFPTETIDEARETFRFLVATQQSWTFAGIGDFVLTPGAIVAREPSRFGIAALRPAPGAFSRSFEWVDEEAKPQSGNRNGFVRQEFSGVGGSIFPRPFLGGIDTAHSLLYFAQATPSDLRSKLKAAYRPLVERQFRTVAFPAVMEFATADELAQQRSHAIPCAFDSTFAEFVAPQRMVDRKPTSVSVAPSGNIYLRVDCGGNDEAIGWIEELFV